MKEKIAVWFSCGAASAVAAYMTVQKYGATHDIRILNNPVLEEHEDNRRFLKDCEAWIGLPIEPVVHRLFPNASAVEIWDDQKGMVFPRGAPCTRYAKKFARQEWERDNSVDWHVLGFTVEEKARHDRFILTERSNVLPVLIEAGLTKQNCYDLLKKAGIEPSAMYALGYPNANCIGCVKATSPTYWNHVRRTHPEIFASRAAQSRRLGARLVRHRGARIYLDELPRDARGQSMKTMAIECGTFCEEPVDSALEPYNSLYEPKFLGGPDVKIKIELNIGVTPQLAGFLEKLLGASTAVAKKITPAPEPEPEETMHAAAAQEVTERPPAEYTVSEANIPQPAKRRGRPPKSDASQDTNASGDPSQPEAQPSSESGQSSGPTATSDASPSDEETLAEALGIADDGEITKDVLETKLREVVDKVGNVKLIQETLLKATGFKGTGSMTPDKYAAGFAALDGLLAA